MNSLGPVLKPWPERTAVTSNKCICDEYVYGHIKKIPPGIFFHLSINILINVLSVYLLHFDFICIYIWWLLIIRISKLQQVCDWCKLLAWSIHGGTKFFDSVLKYYPLIWFDSTPTARSCTYVHTYENTTRDEKHLFQRNACDLCATRFSGSRDSLRFAWGTCTGRVE